MKEKLWIAYGVFAMISLISMFTGNITIAYIMAFISSGFGWVVFFKYY